jgi:hypothetical protein
MATTHSTAIRNSIADTVVDSIDGGTTNPEGRIEIQTAGAVEVATILASNPAFGAATGGVATANAFTDDTNATGGTAAQYEFQNRDATASFFGSVTATGGGGDIELSSVAIGVGDTVSITSFTYTAPV